MRLAILPFFFLAACTCARFVEIGPAQARASEGNNNTMIGMAVIVHLDSNQQYVGGTLVSNTDEGVTVRLSNGKFYFYPNHRVSGVEQQ
jgi:hypothetical protein